jgi:hypothetical protein
MTDKLIKSIDNNNLPNLLKNKNFAACLKT